MKKKSKLKGYTLSSHFQLLEHFGDKVTNFKFKPPYLILFLTFLTVPSIAFGGWFLSKKIIEV